MEEIIKKDTSVLAETSANGSEKVESLIYEIRGQQVMLDSDLGRLYECANGTKTINQAVKRHRDRFPEDFCFQLTHEEYENLKSQLGTSSLGNSYGGVRKMPYVFTEHGASMLSAVIKTEVAAKVSIKIVRAFVAMKRYISSGLIEQKYINKLVFEDHDRIDLLENSLKKFEEKRQDNAIFFNGQIYDAYSKIYEIFREAREELVVIDSYADATILDIVKKLNIKVVIITGDKAPLSVRDIEKYNKQYNNLKVIRNNTFHDRYFILDNKIIYHCGASVNYAGHKTFSITKLNDSGVVNLLRRKISEILT